MCEWGQDRAIPLPGEASGTCHVEGKQLCTTYNEHVLSSPRRDNMEDCTMKKLIHTSCCTCTLLRSVDISESWSEPVIQILWFLQFPRCKTLMLMSFGLPLALANISGTWQYMTLLLSLDYRRSRLFQCCMPYRLQHCFLLSWQRQTNSMGYLDCLPCSNWCGSWLIFSSREYPRWLHATNWEI